MSWIVSYYTHPPAAHKNRLLYVNYTTLQQQQDDPPVDRQAKFETENKI